MLILLNINPSFYTRSVSSIMINILFRRLDIKKEHSFPLLVIVWRRTVLSESPFGKADIKASGHCRAIPADAISKRLL